MIFPLRVNGALRPAAGAQGARQTAGAGASYSPARAGGPAPQSASAPPQPMTSLATLVAVQAVEERKSAQRRATRRGAAILDDLDALKLAILEGRAGQRELDQIARNVSSLREQTGDQGLDSLVDAIELRAKVEMAKRQR